jgi:glycopeptide antibiotics resistance protein
MMVTGGRFDVPVTSPSSRLIPKIALVAYSVLLVWIIILKLNTSLSSLVGRRSLNLVPFGASIESSGLSIRELMLNVVVFVPFGILVVTAQRRMMFLRALVVVVTTSLAFEVLQFITGFGASDITDVLTNSFGGIIGIGIGIAALKICGERSRSAVALVTCGLVAAIVAGIAIWIQSSGLMFRL